ncbi:MAG TPA: NUDIX domain-containing protein [Roseiflexaceae bacterium]|nr:NUDIX domain-containing protein [Roseiflexaceae bacterium]
MTTDTDARPHAAGCVVYRYGADGAPLILLIRDQYGQWTLPKGHLDAGEGAAEAAVREVREETGVSGTLGPLVGEIRYPVTNRRGETYVKRVAFFLLHADGAEVRPQAAEGISAAGWYAPGEALARTGYPDLRGVLLRAVELIGSPAQPSE